MNSNIKESRIEWIALTFRHGRSASVDDQGLHCTADALSQGDTVLARRRDGMIGVTLAGDGGMHRRSAINCVLGVLDASFRIHHQCGHPRIWLNDVVRSVRILDPSEWVWFDEASGDIVQLERDGNTFALVCDPIDDPDDLHEPQATHHASTIRRAPRADPALRTRPAPDRDDNAPVQLDFMGLLRR